MQTAFYSCLQRHFQYMLSISYELFHSHIHALSAFFAQNLKGFMFSDDQMLKQPEGNSLWNLVNACLPDLRVTLNRNCQSLPERLFSVYNVVKSSESPGADTSPFWKGKLEIASVE